MNTYTYTHTHAYIHVPTHTVSAVFRLGTSVDNFRAALLTIHLANPLLRFLLTMVRINRGLFLLIDHLIWAAQMKLVTVDTRFWSRLSNQFWAVSILLSLLRDLYELIVAIQLERNRLIQHSALSPSVSPHELVGNVARNNRALVLDTVKNLTDIWLPTSRLDLVHCPSGVVGIMGVISSAAGLMATYDQCWKLKFS